MIKGAPANVIDFGADSTGATDSSAAIQSAIDSGAAEIYFAPGEYLINTALETFADNQTFTFDSASLLMDDEVNGLTIKHSNIIVNNPIIKSSVDGTWNGFYGIYIENGSDNCVLNNVYCQDIKYNAVLIDSSFCTINGIKTENCGWDSVVFFENATDNFVTDLYSYRSGRSAVGTDVGSTRNVVDGGIVIDNGSPLVTDQHHDVLHFEGAIDSVFRNIAVYYTTDHPAASSGLTGSDNNCLRFNAASGCIAENISVTYATSCDDTLQFASTDANPNDVILNNITVNNKTTFPLLFYIDLEGSLPGVFNVNSLVVSGPFTMQDESNESGVARNFTNCSFSYQIHSTPAANPALYVNTTRANNVHFTNCTFDSTNTICDAAGWQYSSITGCTFNSINGYILKTYAFTYDATYRPKNGVISHNNIKDVYICFDFYQGQGVCAVTHNVFNGDITTMVLSNGSTGGVGGTDSRFADNIVIGTVTNMNPDLDADANEI